MEHLVYIRNKSNGFLYRNIVKPIAFLFDAEKVHKFFIKVGKILGKLWVGRKITRLNYYYKNKILHQNILGIKFDNPIGLSAGFDKNAEIIPITSDIGFGFSEVGSVTKFACGGNDGKRLERIKEKESLWVNLGLNNSGCDEITSRLSEKKFNIPVAISIAKTNCKESADDKVGIADYVYSLNKFNKLNVGDFYVLNISCPNSYGGQPFSRETAFNNLLKEVNKIKVKKPIFIKLSPDLTNKNLDTIIKLSKKYGVKGFICSNLTKEHSMGKGGLSGKAVESKANELLRYVYSKTKGNFVLIAVGGVFTAEDAYKKIKLGANLVELITGMIYRGPNIVSEINQGIVKLLKKDGYNSIYEAIGKDSKLVAQ